MQLNAYRNISQIATLASAHAKDGRRLVPEDLGIISNAAVVFNEQEIVWVGEDEKLPCDLNINNNIDSRDKVLVPEIVDSHTHLVFAGDRSDEYCMRLNGADYEEIAKQGGGIIASMTAMNSISFEELKFVSIKRIEKIASYGVGTIEIKSGYGLNYEKEKQISLLIHELKQYFKNRIQIINTYMAAHAVTKQYQNSTAYLERVVLPLLKELAPLSIIDAVDIFHEKGYFETEDVKKLFELATQLNIPLKSHADEFHDNRGAELAVQYKALSTDHLLCTSKTGIEQLSTSNTVATLLPGTGYFLGKQQANARQFLDAGVKVAIASDYNPGSCHFDNVLFLAALSAPQYKMNIAELWTSITLNAAHALGLKKQGALIPGLKPRFTLFKVNRLNQVTYSWGDNLAVPK